MVSNILIPLDGSEHSEKALHVGCDIAIKYGAAVHLMHVTQFPVRDQTLALGGAAVSADATPEELADAGTSLIDFASEYARKRGITEVTTQLKAGDPARLIIERARESQPDMIVMGTRGLSNIAGLLLGSVSHKVTNMVSCTCVTVR
ncbi:MAG: universal stress protein [Arenicellales bacterium]